MGWDKNLKQTKEKKNKWKDDKQQKSWKTTMILKRKNAENKKMMLWSTMKICWNDDNQIYLIVYLFN